MTRLDLIWHTPPPKTDPEPMPFEFPFEVTNEEMVTVSGFWNYYYQKIEELTILDNLKKDVTKKYSNEDYLMAIENHVKLNYL